MFRGLEPYLGVSSHLSELPFPHLENGSSGSPLPPWAVTGRDHVTPQVRVQGGYGARNGCDGGKAGKWRESASLGTPSTLDS